MIGVYKLEVVGGTSKFEKTGLGYDREAKESIDTAFRYFKDNSRNISASISTTVKDYLMHIQYVNGVGMTSSLSLDVLRSFSKTRTKPTCYIRFSKYWWNNK